MLGNVSGEIGGPSKIQSPRIFVEDGSQRAVAAMSTQRRARSCNRFTVPPLAGVQTIPTQPMNQSRTFAATLHVNASGKICTIANSQGNCPQRERVLRVSLNLDLPSDFHVGFWRKVE
jgi:hypothetical protein